jgi:SPP1 gp7 family putative phage head morphogenesis protein
MPKKAEFHPAKRVQLGYERGIRRITGRVLLKRLPDETFDQWYIRLQERSRQMDIQEASEELARRMVVQVNVGNMRTWREAAARHSKSALLHKALEAELRGPTGARVQQLVRENAALISSLSLEAAQKMNEEVTKAAQGGARPETIAKLQRRRFPELLRSRVNLISRTETAKASTALTQARCERLSIDWYIWETSRDVRTRPSHKAMNGVVVPWTHAPSPETLIGEKSQGNYQAGQIFNCRCLILPVLTLDDIAFPARIYWNGSVKTMDKQTFKKIAVHMEERLVA